MARANKTTPRQGARTLPEPILAALGASPQPNEVDRRRIERALEERARYRYVTPQVLPVAGGYRVVSPCCSRNVDAEGGEIDIAWIEYQAGSGAWRLHCKDHPHGEWALHTEGLRLQDLLQVLNEDSERVFWQ